MISDTITAMHRRGQLTDRQYRAAQRYRLAVDALQGSNTGSTDMARVIGSPCRSHLPATVEATEIVNDAALLLGYTDGRVVSHIVGRGETIQECAAQVFGTSDDRRRRSEAAKSTGERLRIGLDVLANRWWPEDSCHATPLNNTTHHGAPHHNTGGVK